MENLSWIKNNRGNLVPVLDGKIFGKCKNSERSFFYCNTCESYLRVKNNVIIKKF